MGQALFTFKASIDVLENIYKTTWLGSKYLIAIFYINK